MSFTRTLKHTAAAVAFALPVVGVQQMQAQVGGIAVGSMAPAAMTVPTLDNTSFDFAGVVGKQPVVMEFWATWCPLCRKLEPAMEAAKAKYGNRISFIHELSPHRRERDRRGQCPRKKRRTPWPRQPR